MDGNKLYPLTHPQQRIWLSEKLHPGTGMWNNAGTIKVRGPLDEGLLEKAVNHVIKNNEALRICITQVNGEPFQYVREFEYKKLEFLDFSQTSISELYEWDGIQSQARMPLLDCELFYFCILKVSDQECGLYAKVHHIISDAWSVVMICNQIMESYDRLLGGEELPRLQNGSYIVYVAKEKEYLESKRFAYDEAALGEIFAGLPEPAILKQKKPGYTSTRARRRARILNNTIADQMRAYCEQNDSTIFALYLAGLCVYINRILGKDDIMIGVPVFNRTTPEEKNTAGMFVSTVPVRIKVSEDMEFGAFVEMVSNEWFRMLKHQKYPYELLISNLRKTNKNLESLYDITLSHQNARFEKRTRNFSYEGRWHFAGSQVNSLSIHINDREGEGRLIVDYDHHIPLFSLKEIEYIHTHCETILADAITHPDKKLYELNIMEPEELNRIFAFNDNEAEYPKNRGLDALFLEQMNRTPEGTAMIAGTGAFTYAQLNSLVNKTAQFLKSSGVGRGSIVGILIKRDHSLLVSILAVLRAGGAFLPIDPDLPIERVQYELTESKAACVIASPHLAAKCSGICPVVEADGFDSLPEYSGYIPSNNHMEDLAYVIYTSGSTGKPKGVMVEQHSIVHFMYATSEVLDFTPGNVVLSSANVAFDVFVKEFTLTIMGGATLVLAGEHEQSNSQNLVSLINRTGINKFMTIPTRMQLFLTDKGAGECLKNMREVTLGGEVLQPSLLAKIKEKTPAKIVNFYGPTEATIAATCKDLTDTNVINIGNPIPGIYAYILDKHKNPVPIGVHGELYIGGAGLARGYLNRPDLTEAAFVKNPFRKGERMYKTGDITRWYPMGEIEFIGRADQQVKIRGLRIEPEEIANAISAYENILDAVVVDCRKGDAHFLCAYYTKKGAVEEPKLRDSLRKRLPAYMIPQYFVSIDHLPMTPNGKLDKNALPDPELFTARRRNAANTKDMTATEKKMAKAWGKILRVKKIAKDDNFFELGGDSLAAIRVQNEMMQYGIDLKIQDFYELETLDAICRRIDAGIADNTAAAADPDAGFQTMAGGAKRGILRVAQDSYTYNLSAGEPLAQRILAGELPRLDSAALTYIPDDVGFTSFAGPDTKPVLYNYMDTGFGAIGVIALPISGRHIYNEKEKLISLSMQGIRLAKELGAKVVSLTGLIPSATGYGTELAEACARECAGARITTGHTTTAASVILSLERLLRESGRSIAGEDICVLGLGSIGTTVTKLLLSVLPHPASVTLCDIAQKGAYLDGLTLELKEKYGYNGRLRVACAKRTTLPDPVYESTLIIGATNVPDLLDVDRLKPGTLIIDDSGPHCFSKEKAVRRLKNAADIVFTEGGVLQTPNPIIKTNYLPPFINPNIIAFYHQHFLGKNEITGCILSGLLSAKYEQLEPVVGPVRIEDCRKHYELLKNESFDGALLHCDDYVIPKDTLEKFRAFKLQAAMM